MTAVKNRNYSPVVKMPEFLGARKKLIIRRGHPPEQLPQKKWQAPTSRNPDDARQSDAGLVPSGPAARRGGRGVSSLLRVPPVSIHGRRDRTDVHSSFALDITSVGSGRGYRRMFRQHLPRLASPERLFGREVLFHPPRQILRCRGWGRFSSPGFPRLTG